MIKFLNKHKKQPGITLLEALISTAIVGIGFVAIFQMVNFSVQSIDTSGERTKANYLVSMIAEDIIGHRNTIYGANAEEENIVFNGKNVKLMHYAYSDIETENCIPISESIVNNLKIEGENYGPVIQILQGEDEVEICGLTIAEGEANYGGGIYIYKA